MIKAFVHQKGIKHVHVHSHSSGSKHPAKNFLLKIAQFVGVKFLWSVVFLFALFYISVFFFKHIMFVSDYRITTIAYATGSIQKYDDPYLYKEISSHIKGENYYIIKWGVGSILRSVQAKFPIVSDIVVEYKTKNTLSVFVDFYEPDMVVKNQDLLFGIYNNYVFPLYSGNALGKNKNLLYLPLYASGLTTIDGLFFKQSAKALQQQMDLIYQAFPQSKFVAYLPGAERTVLMTADNKKIFINNLADISQQIKNFEFLRKYYSDYNQLREIDLGSLEKDKVIVKK